MGRRKLSDTDKFAIRGLYAAGESISSIATKWNVSFQTIRRVVKPEVYEQDLKKSVVYNAENRKRLYEQHKAISRRYVFILNKETDKEIIEHLDAQENTSAYIRALIQKDINNDCS